MILSGPFPKSLLIEIIFMICLLLVETWSPAGDGGGEGLISLPPSLSKLCNYLLSPQEQSDLVAKNVTQKWVHL